MPDFDVQLSGGFTDQVWTDTPDGDDPSRINPRPGRPHRQQLLPSWVGSFTASAVVGGAVGPLDAALGGRLFSWWWVEAPALALAASLPPLAPAAGHSSVVVVSPFPANMVTQRGHWVLGCRRTDGGAVLAHFDCESVT